MDCMKSNIEKDTCLNDLSLRIESELRKFHGKKIWVIGGQFRYLIPKVSNDNGIPFFHHSSKTLAGFPIVYVDGVDIFRLLEVQGGL